MKTFSKEYKYSAFVSYNHADKIIARKLHRAIEQVSFEDSGTGKKKNLFPAFIDKEEMLGGVRLDGELKLNLEKSKYLVVVCTPNSAESATVQQEIEYFKTLPQGNNIIPVILDRFEDLEEGSFPKALGFREKGAMSLAVNLGGEKAFKRQVDRLSLMKIAAPIAEVPLQELWSREKNRLNRNRSLMAASAVLAIISSLIYWDLFYREFDQGYKNFYRTPYGWQGVQSVGEHAGQHYRFMKTGRLGSPHTVWLKNDSVLCDRLVSTTQLDLYSFRFSAIHQNNPNVLSLCKASFSYRKNGEVEMETLQTSTAPNGEELQFIEEFKYPTDHCSNTGVVFSASLDCQGELRTGIGRFDVKVGYKNDRFSKITAQQTFGPRRSGDEVFTSHFIEYKYDVIGQFEEVEYSDLQSNFVAKLQLEHRDGNLTKMNIPDFGTHNPVGYEFDKLVFAYDSQGRLSERRMLKDDQLVNPAKSYMIGSPEDYVQLASNAYVAFDYQKQNQVSIKFLDLSGQEVEILGVHEIRKTQRPAGFIWEFYDARGLKTEDPNGLHKSVSESVLAQKERTIKRAWFNKVNEPTIGPLGYSSMVTINRYRYSGEGLSGISLSKGLMANRYFYDEEGLLIEDESGIAYLKAEHDQQDRIIQLSLHDADGELVENSLGISKVTWDANGNQQKCYSSFGDPVALWVRRSDAPTPHKIGCARENLYGYSMIFSQITDRDDPSKVLEEIDAVGNSLNDRRVTGHRTFSHLEGGITLEKSIDYILNQNTKLHNLQIQKKWNGSILLEEGYYDRNSDERINNQFGYSFARYSRENSIFGSKQTINFFDKDDNPVRETSTGAYTMVNHMDGDNRIVQQSFYDSDLAPRTPNYHSIKYDYLDGGNRMLATAYRSDDSVFPLIIGGIEFFSMVYFDRNAQGAYTKKQFLDEDEQVITLADGTYLVQLETDPISSQEMQVWSNQQGAVLGRSPIFPSSILSW